MVRVLIKKLDPKVVIPSYKISGNWNNPHYEAWLKAGGWKDK